MRPQGKLKCRYLLLSNIFLVGMDWAHFLVFTGMHFTKLVYRASCTIASGVRTFDIATLLAGLEPFEPTTFRWSLYFARPMGLLPGGQTKHPLSLQCLRHSKARLFPTDGLCSSRRWRDS